MEPRAGGVEPVAVSRHIPSSPPHPTAGGGSGFGGRAGPGLWPAAGGRFAGSGGLAGRRAHVNKSRTSPDICRELCCPFTHSLLIPRGHFMTGGGLLIYPRCHRPC